MSLEGVCAPAGAVVLVMFIWVLYCGLLVLCLVEALPTLLDIAVREAVERILAKVREGKKLTDAEVTLLLVGELARRIDGLEKRVEESKEAFEKRVSEVREELSSRISEIRDVLSKRIDDSRDVVAARVAALEKRVEGLEGEVRGLRAEVSSIKSDVIVLLRSWLEERRGEG